MPNLQAKKGTGNSNLEQTVIFMELFVYRSRFFRFDHLSNKKKQKMFGKDRGSIRNYFWILK